MALGDRSVPGVGAVWAGGAFIKPIYRVPALRTILLNIKRLINANQAVMFSNIEAWEGITLPTEDTNIYFNNDSIHIGVSPDPSKAAIWIDGKKKIVKRTDARIDNVTVTIYATMPGNDYEDTYGKATCIHEGILSLFDVVNPQELVKNWPNNSTGGTQTNQQPEVKILNIYTADPDAAQGELANRIGAIPTLIIELQISSKENK